MLAYDRRRVRLVSVFAAGVSYCALAAPLSAQGEGALPLTPCAEPVAGEEVLCGTLTVPEDPTTGVGSIDLSVVVLPATGQSPEPDPVFPLHGGPGAAARFLVGLFASHPLRESRDFVFVDQRGTGKSNGLHCEPTELADLLDVILLFGMPTEDCRAVATNPRLYATSIAMDDLDTVRRAMGYSQINVWGGSYGSRAALEYMRRYPESVRTVLLDGAAPTDMYIPLYFPPGAQAALDLVIDDCARDEACSDAFPDVGETLTGLLDRVDRRPQRVTVVDQVGGEEVSLEFGREHVASSVLFALYNRRTAAQLPSWIHQAHQGDLAPLAQFAVGFSRGLAPQFAFGMMMAVACAEDAARYTPSEAANLAKGSFLGPELATSFIEACAGWPTEHVDPSYWTPIRSDAPTLVFSGQGDPVTPPQWAERALQHLPNGRHAVFTDNGHGATGLPCGTRLFEEFVNAGTAEHLDLRCAQRTERPPWGGLSRSP